MLNKLFFILTVCVLLWPTHATKLFGINASGQLVSIDTNQYHITPLSPAPLSYVLWAHNSMQDPNDPDFFYTIGYDWTSFVLIGVSASSYKTPNPVTLKQSLPFQTTRQRFTEGLYWDMDTKTGRVLITGYSDAAYTTRLLISMDPKTGTYKNITSFSASPDTPNAIGTFADSTNTEYLLEQTPTAQSLTAINVDNGQIRKMSLPSGSVQAMEFDPLSKKIYLILSNQTETSQLMLFALNVQNSVLQLVSHIPSYKSLFGSLATISPKERLMYILSATTPDLTANSPLDLIALDLDSGEVRSSVFACYIGNCPKSFLYAGQ